MNNNKKSLSGMFKSNIFQALEKVDINNPVQRKSVYTAAFESLENAQKKNAAINEENKIQQQNTLEKAITEIEEQISGFMDSSTSHTLDAGQVTPKNESKIELEENEIKASSFVASFRIWISSRSIFSSKPGKRSILLFASVLFLAVTSIVSLNHFGKNHIDEEFPLPHILKADASLYKYAITRGNSILKLINEPDGGIFYESDLLEENASNSLDFRITGRLSDKINKIKKPILITFDVQKKNLEDVSLELIFRGSKQISSKTVEILDQNVNEYFITTNIAKNFRDRKHTLIRLKVTPRSKNFTGKLALLLKRITFSTL